MTSTSLLWLGFVQIRTGNSVFGPLDEVLRREADARAAFQLAGGDRVLS